MSAIFIYGTLLNNEVLNLIVSTSYKKRDAKLLGYRRVRVFGEVFPAIYPSKESSVKGALLTDVSDDDIQSLDEYETEGLLYTRTPVNVIVDHAVYDCEAYVLREEHYDLLTNESWDNQVFREQCMHQFVNTISGDADD